MFAFGFLYSKHGPDVDTNRELTDEEAGEMKGSFTYANQFSSRLKMIEMLTKPNFVVEILNFQERYEQKGIYLTRLNGLKLKLDMKIASGEGYEELNAVLIELREQIAEFENLE